MQKMTVFLHNLFRLAYEAQNNETLYSTAENAISQMSPQNIFNFHRILKILHLSLENIIGNRNKKMNTYLIYSITKLETRFAMLVSVK